MRLGVIIVAAILLAQCAAAQNSQDSNPASATTGAEHHDAFMRMPVFGDVVRDQKAIATGAWRVRLHDAIWAAPLAGIAAGMLVTDEQFSRHLNASKSRIDNSNKLSDYGVAGLAAAGGGMFLWGKLRGNDHESDAGYLTGEAMGAAMIDVEALKFMFGRSRPLQANGSGSFWNGGQSFPSEHAALAWSAATVLAHEYPGPLTKLFVYGGAAAVSAARVTGKDHFPSDVLIGSALGYYVGNTVWRSHHEARDDAQYGTFVRSETERQPADMGSPYVPVDSWIYGAFDRLAAMGYVQSNFAGLRPWTRMECARLLGEADDRIAGDDGAPEARGIIAALHDELRHESGLLDGGANYAASLDSVYTRVQGISGPTLNDGYHFAQTQTNDYGRPYAEGANAIAGFTSHATAGPLTVYVQGEYQHAPSNPALPLGARQWIAHEDTLPTSLVPPGTAAAGADRPRIVEGYVALAARNWQFSFGKQSLWWGPEKAGPMLFSNNAEPITMFRVSRVSPISLPFLGEMRSEFFLGQLDGYHLMQGPSGLIGNWDEPLRKQPFVHGEKISFKPTENLEFSVSRTTVFAGSVYPLNFHTFRLSLLSTSNPGTGVTDKPGDRRSGFDITYRVPKLRHWLTLYADGFTDDEFSPIGYWDRSAWTAGAYLPQLPGIPKLDFRAEGIFTDVPPGGALSHGFFYFNGTWRNGYTSDGELLGSWIGREGQGAQAWSVYHFNARNTLSFDFRHQKVSSQFVENGGTLTDAGVQSNFRIASQLIVSGGMKYERWNFPVIAPQQKRNLTTSIQLIWEPRWK